MNNIPDGFNWFEEFKIMKQDIEKLKKITKELQNEIDNIYFNDLKMAIADVCKIKQINMDDYKNNKI